MRRTKTLLLSLLVCTLSFAQPERPKEYFDFVRKAEIYYQSKDYKNSAFAYSSAFKANGWKGMPDDRWNAACSWALANYADSAFFNLFGLANKTHITAYSRITTDPDLNSLHADKRWATLLEIIQRNKDSAEINLNKPLVRQLESIFTEDQKYRLQLDAIENNTAKSSEQKSKELRELWKTIEEKDLINLIQVEAILDKYGWLGPDVIGEQGNSTLFLVIQHADPETQAKYLPLMREAVKKGKAKGADLALLEDRIALAQGKKQIYGSQLKGDGKGKYKLSPIEDEANVNKRRAAVGLEPIEEYLKHWGIVYKPAGTTNIQEGFWEKHSVTISFALTALLSLLILFILFRQKQTAWFCFFLLVFILHFTDLYSETSRPYSFITEYGGNWILFAFIRPLSYFLIGYPIKLVIYKLFKIKNMFIDAGALFASCLLYSYVLVGVFQKLFVPTCGIRFFFNIIEPAILCTAFLVISLPVYLISKYRKKKAAKNSESSSDSQE